MLSVFGCFTSTGRSSSASTASLTELSNERLIGTLTMIVLSVFFDELGSSVWTRGLNRWRVSSQLKAHNILSLLLKKNHNLLTLFFPFSIFCIWNLAIWNPGWYASLEFDCGRRFKYQPLGFQDLWNVRSMLRWTRELGFLLFDDVHFNDKVSSIGIHVLIGCQNHRFVSLVYTLCCWFVLDR